MVSSLLSGKYTLTCPPGRWVFKQIYDKGMVYRGYKVKGGRGTIGVGDGIGV